MKPSMEPSSPRCSAASASASASNPQTLHETISAASTNKQAPHHASLSTLSTEIEHPYHVPTGVGSATPGAGPSSASADQSKKRKRQYARKTVLPPSPLLIGEVLDGESEAAHHVLLPAASTNRQALHDAPTDIASRAGVSTNNGAKSSSMLSDKRRKRLLCARKTVRMHPLPYGFDIDRGEDESDLSSDNFE